MKFRDNYVVSQRPNASTFYGVVHHDAQEVDRSWESLHTTHSMEDVFGVPKKENNEEQQSKTEYTTVDSRIEYAISKRDVTLSARN